MRSLTSPSGLAVYSASRLVFFICIVDKFVSDSLLARIVIT